MSKKIWYSRPLADVWKNYQKANKNGDLTPKQFVKMWLAPILKNKTNNEYTVQSYLLVGDMFYADSEKLFLHLFFVDKALRDFLLDIPLADFDAVINF
ncbi:MAG: hypothetical protein K6G52_06935, partial [Treponemataceae bacterium]|nr:hypothetical protein [Treponemataceae bacterium]